MARQKKKNYKLVRLTAKAAYELKLGDMLMYVDYNKEDEPDSQENIAIVLELEERKHIDTQYNSLFFVPYWIKGTGTINNRTSGWSYGKGKHELISDGRLRRWWKVVYTGYHDE